jgi:tetratricopeptide (TPR) repeat protein
VLDLLASLVQKSLVIYEEDEQGQGRYRLLETVRQYGRDRLLEASEAEGVRGRHRDWFLALAEEAEPKLHSIEWVGWLDRLEAEHDNLRAALAWCQRQGEVGLELRLAGAVAQFWVRRSCWEEGRQWVEGALGRAGSGADNGDREFMKARAQALRGSGLLAMALGEGATARSRVEESIRLYRALGDRGRLAWALANLCFIAGDTSAGEESVVHFREAGNKLGLIMPLYHLGNAALVRGDLAGARSLYEESLALAREMGDRWYLARPIAGLGSLAWSQGDYAAARSYFEETVALRRAVQDFALAEFIFELGIIVSEQGDYQRAAALFEESLALSQKQGGKRDIAQSLAGLGAVLCHQGDHEAARSLCEQSIVISRECGGKRLIAQSLTALGEVAFAQGDAAKARLCHAESLALWRELEEETAWRPGKLARCLECLASVAVAEGDPERAARLLGAARALRECHSAPLSPADQCDYDRNIAAIHTALGEERFVVAWAEGRTMALEAAVSLALEEPSNA